jgi:hypothetical protein
MPQRGRAVAVTGTGRDRLRREFAVELDHP